MKICPSCGEPVNETEAVCSACGQPVEGEGSVEELVRYRSAMITGLVIEYLAEGAIYLQKSGVFDYTLITQLGTLAFYAGFLMILVFTFKLTRLMGLSLVLCIVTSILNCFLLINIGITIYLNVLFKRMVGRKV